MNDKQLKAAAYLDKVTTKTMTYAEARRALLQDGFTEEEVTQAVSVYEDSRPKISSPQNNIAPDDATIAIAKAKLGFVTEKALGDEQASSMAIAMIIPNKAAKSYFFGKFLKSHADAKSLEENGKFDAAEQGRLYKRYRFIRYNVWAGIIGLIFITMVAGPSLWQSIQLLYYRPGSNLVITVLSLLGLASWVLAFTSPFVLFFTKKESMMKIYIVSACIIPGLIGVVLGIILRNYFILGAALLGILFALWQSKRVGILSI